MAKFLDLNGLEYFAGKIQTALNGRAPATHEHSADDITSGVLPISRGGTGATSLEEAKAALGIDAIKPEDIGAQEKLTGAKGQIVGFDENGNAVPQEAASGGGAHAASHKTGGSDELKPADIGAQSVLKGTKGQVVGFNEKGEAVPQEAPAGASAHAASHKTGGSDALTPSDIGAQAALKGTAGQFVGFNSRGEAVPVEAPTMESTAGAYFGTIGTNWSEDSNTGVKFQKVSIQGVTADMELGVLDVINTHARTSEGYTLFVEEQNQFLQYITNGDAETVDGGVMFYIYGEPNTVNIPFALEVG